MNEKETIRYCIHCPCCGTLLQKSSLADTEIRCRKCNADLELHVEGNEIIILKK